MLSRDWRPEAGEEAAVDLSVNSGEKSHSQQCCLNSFEDMDT